MRNHAISLRALLFVIATLLFISCRKDSHHGPRPKFDWLLSTVNLSYLYYDQPDIPADSVSQIHYFYYNAFKKPWVHTTANRQDTFCYDHRLRLSEIRSILHVDLDSAVRQRKVIRYDRMNQKCATLMFIFDEEMNRYRLTDSTVYAYQDTTIIRTTYHFALAGERKAVAAAIALETDIFLYNRKGNLVKKIDGDVLGGTSEKIYDDYDDAPNPYRLLNLEGLELELAAGVRSDYHPDFRIAMDMPKFSKNNYHYTNTPEGPRLTRFSVLREAEDSLVSRISRRVGGLGITENRQDFQYSPYNE